MTSLPIYIRYIYTHTQTHITEKQYKNQNTNRQLTQQDLADINKILQVREADHKTRSFYFRIFGVKEP